MENILSFLSSTDIILINQLKDLFLEVDKSVEHLKEVTGIHCPDRCGICCLKSRIDTTAIEMLPLALELWERGEAERWLDEIDKVEDNVSCVFYKSDPEGAGEGRCMVYSLRPLICRLFGFFTIKDKNGGYVYGGCKIIREHTPEIHKRAVELIKQGAHPSTVTNYTIRILSMSTELSRKMVPINIAARGALEKIGFEVGKKNWGIKKKGD